MGRTKRVQMPIGSTMRQLFATLLLAGACLPAVSEVVVTNPERAVYYYVEGTRVPADMSRATMDYISPGGFRLFEGDSVRLAGFFFVPGRTTHPGLSVEGAGMITIPSSPEFLVDALVPPSVATPIRLDGRFLEWNRVPPLARFSRHHTPDVVERTDDSGSRSIDPEQALFYGRGGSDLELIRAIRSSGDVYFMLSAFSGFSSGFSAYLYGFDGPSAAAARYTVQIAVTDEMPAVLLWRPDRSEPQVIGTFARSTFFMEAVLWRDRLPEDFLRDIEFFEVSTSITDTGILEEYPLSRVMVDEIPVAE